MAVNPHEDYLQYFRNWHVLLFKERSCSKTKIVVKYDQELPQSQTADNPVAPRGRAIQQSRDTRKTNKTNQPAVSSPFPGLNQIHLS